MGAAGTGTLRVGGLLPNVGTAASADAIATFATEGERLGLSSLWVGDHLLLAEQQDARYPYNDTGDYVVPADRNFLEAFTTLAWVAARTERARLGVSVCIAPYRHPVQVAKILGTIEFLAPGRMVLGVGTGWMEDEFNALGVPFAERNDRTAGLIRFLRRAGRADGAFPIDLPRENAGYPTERMFLRPAPAADLPVWVGGNGPLARRRAARLGDAWHPALHNQSPDQLRVEMEQVRELAAGHGRDPDAIELTLFVGVALADKAYERPWERGLLRGPAPAVVEHLLAYAEAGVSEVILSIGGSVNRRLALITDLADAGLPLPAA